MRVLHLTTEYPPIIYGGLGTAVGGWVSASARAGMTLGVLLIGHDTTIDVPTRYGGSTEAPDGSRDFGSASAESAVVDDHGIAFFRRDPAAVDECIRLVQAWKPDVLHVHTAMIWPVVQAIRDHTALPLVFHVHSVDKAEYELGEEPMPWLVDSAQSAAIAQSDRLIALCRDERDLLIRYFPSARGKIRVIGNGITTDWGDPLPSRRPPHHRPPRPTMVLYSGRLVPRKGIDELLAAVPGILQTAPQTEFVIAGGPPPLTGPQLADRWLTDHHHHCRQKIHFTGWLTANDLAAWYRRADLLVVPSRYEPFGMVLLEGMLHGLPIVAANVGGPAEIIDDPTTGLLFRPRDVEGLTRAVLTLVRDPAMRHTMGRAAARDVRQRWAWPKLVADMRTVYQELVPTHPPTR